MWLKQFLTSLLLMIITALTVQTPAKAWFHKKPVPAEDPAKQVQTYQPPPENAMQVYCEPYRREAALRSQANFLIKPLHWPRRLWLMKEYRKCTDGLMTQEYNYLKHADIELAPSLPKIKPLVEPINQPSSTKTTAKPQQGATGQ